MVKLKMNKLLNKIFLGDSLDLIKMIPDHSVDLICIDPPYEINFENNDWDKKQLDWHLIFSQYQRVLKPETGNLIVFQGWSNVPETILIGREYFPLKNWIIYDRIKGRGAKTNLVSTREDILWFVNGKSPTYNKIPSNIKKKTGGLGLKNGEPNRALSNVWSDISPIVPWSKERVKHPTQKPIQLMERIVKIWSNENDLVLDCFAGSGSTLVAAKNLSRNFIGIEKDEDFVNICLERLT
jgi:site-specific DNA-methyltransferase (adenine-specific)